MPNSLLTLCNTMAQLSHQMAQAAEGAHWDELLDLEPRYLQAFDAFVAASKAQAGMEEATAEAQRVVKGVLQDNQRLVQAVAPWLTSMRPKVMQSVAHNALAKAYKN